MTEEKKKVSQPLDSDHALRHLNELFQSDDLPKFYANGFINFQGSADMGILFQTNGKVVALVNFSFTTAKTLANKLNEIVREFEESTGNTIMTIDDINDKKGEKK